LSQDLNRWQRDAYDTPPRETRFRSGCRDELLGIGWIVLGVLIIAGIVWVLTSTGVVHCLPMVSCS
jgi:hypothetical protein